MSQALIWKKLRTPYGPAGMVPRLVEQMTHAEWYDAQERDSHREAYDGLTESLLLPGAWATASAPTVELLLNGNHGLGAFAYNLCLAASIAAGVGLDYWARGRRRDEANPYQMACWGAVMDKSQLLFKMLMDTRHEIRGAVAYLLSVIPPLRRESLAALEQQWIIESAGIIKACLLQALDELDETGRWQEVADALVVEKQADPALLGMAALISLRYRPGQTRPEMMQALQQWLSLNTWISGQDSSLVLRGDPDEVLATLVEAQLRDKHDEVVDTVIELGNRAEPRPRCFGRHHGIERVIDQLLGLSSDHPLIPEDQLSPTQRKLATGLIDAHVYAEGGWMPPRGKPRKKWLNLGY